MGGPLVSAPVPRLWHLHDEGHPGKGVDPSLARRRYYPVQGGEAPQGHALQGGPTQDVEHLVCGKWWWGDSLEEILAEQAWL